MATNRPIINIYSSSKRGKIVGNTSLPGVFEAPIRSDIVRDLWCKMLLNTRAPQGRMFDAGMQHSAESWGTGRAVSRIPRVSGGGTHKAGQGAFGNMCKGGRMFAPLKTWRHWYRTISHKQRKYAICSAIAGSGQPAFVMARGHSVDLVYEFPLVVDNAIGAFSKAREAMEFMKLINAHHDIYRAKRNKSRRAGKGKYRGRIWQRSRGPLIVYNQGGKGIKYAFRNLPGVETCHVNKLSLHMLAPGGNVGRFIVWQKSAFEKLDNIWGTYDHPAANGFTLPKASMHNADIGMLIQSDVIRSAIRSRRNNGGELSKYYRKQKGGYANPFKNQKAMIKLNPYNSIAKAQKRREQTRAAKRMNVVNAKRSFVDF